MKIIHPTELQTWITENRDFQLVDVREDWEREIVSLPNSVHLSMQAVAMGSGGNLDPQKAVVVYCKSGGRSSFAAAALEMMGFKDVYNLAGGIDAYRQQVAPSMQGY